MVPEIALSLSLSLQHDHATHSLSPSVIARVIVDTVIDDHLHRLPFIHFSFDPPLYFFLLLYLVFVPPITTGDHQPSQILVKDLVISFLDW